MHCVTFLRLQAGVILLGSLSLVRAYRYEEIQKLNASCSPKDTCSVPRDLDNWDAHNCDCGSLCVLYGSCCIDSPFLNFSRKYERTASCRQVELSGKSVYMIDVCSSGYKGPATLRRRCEQTAKNWSDPFNNVPVTNTRSLKTYKNVFCGLCNGEQGKDLKMWQVVIDCSSLGGHGEACTDNKDFVLNNMMYIQEKGVWGIWSWDPKTDWKFRNLIINFQIPTELEALVKECRPNLVSKCHPSWRGSRRTEQLCGAYMGTVYFRDVAFRNAHCALCNHVADFSRKSCHHDQVEFKGMAVNFGLLLDFNLKDGDKVGNVEIKCDDGQVFDPFSKKCRTIECPLPGYSLKDGKCVAD